MRVIGCKRVHSLNEPSQETNQNFREKTIVYSITTFWESVHIKKGKKSEHCKGEFEGLKRFVTNYSTVLKFYLKNHQNNIRTRSKMKYDFKIFCFPFSITKFDIRAKLRVQGDSRSVTKQ